MKKQIRSPNYPRKSLPQVMARLKRYSDNISLEKGLEKQIAHQIGYSGLTGAAIPFVSAFKKFELLEQIDSYFSFKEEVFDLIELTPDKYKERKYAKLIEKIAFSPDIFNELRNHFGKSFPNREELTNYLKIKKFVGKSIPKVIDSYEQTFNLVSFVNDEYKNEYYEKDLVDLSLEISGSHNSNETSLQNFKYELTDKIEIIVNINGTPSAEDFKMLAKFQENLEDLIS